MNPPVDDYWNPYLDAAIQKEALNYILQHPLHILSQLPARAWNLMNIEHPVRLFFANTSIDFPATVPVRIGILLNTSYWLVLTLSCGSCFLLIKTRQARMMTLLIPFLYNIASYLPFFGVPRFRWPLQFVLLIYAAAFPSLLHAYRARCHTSNHTALDGALDSTLR